MVLQIIKEKPRQPSFARQLLMGAEKAAAYGAEAIPQFIQQQRQEKAEEQEFQKLTGRSGKNLPPEYRKKVLEQQTKSLEKVGSTFDFYRKNFGFEDLPPEDLQSIYLNARNLVEQGYSPDDAVQNSFRSYTTQSLVGPAGEERKATGKGLMGAPIGGAFGVAGSLGAVKEGAKKLFAPPEERAPAEPRANIQQLLQEADMKGPREFNKLLSTLSREEFLQLPKNQQIALSKQIGEIAQQESERTIARGIFGAKGVDKIAEAAGLPEIEFGTKQAQAVGETYGRLLRDYGLFRMAGAGPKQGPGPSTLMKGARAATLFGGAAAGEQLLAGEEPTLGHVGLNALTGFAAEVAPELGIKLFKFLKSKIPVKVPKPLHGPFKQPPPPPGTRPRTPPPPPGGPSGPQSAAEAGEVYNNIINDAVRNLEGRGITLEMVNAGDPAAIKALQEEASKATNLYKQAQKVNAKQFAKQQEEIVKKVSQSPLEKYYEPKKEVVSRPDTIAKNLERIKPLELSIKQNERRVRDLQYQILSADEAIREGKLLPQELERVRATRQSNALAHARAMNEIQNAKFEIKYGRAPMSLEDIGKQIETTFNELREGIKNPEAKKVETFKKGFERDKHMIDEALKLAERGKLPGPEVFDKYTKIHNEYLKAYDTLIDELSAFVKEHKGKPRWGKKVENTEKLLDVIKNQRKLSQAKIKLQEDKRKVMGLLEKPSGAFIKNSLRDIRKDVGAFQRDFFTWEKEIGKYSPGMGSKQRIEKIARERIKPLPEVQEATFQRQTQGPKEPPKVEKKHAKGEAGQAKETAEAAKEAAKNPTAENVETAAEYAGMTKEEYQEHLNKVRQKVEALQSKIKSGETTAKDEMGLFKQIMQGYKRLNRYPKAIVSGVVIGTAQGVIEELFGKKIPAGYISVGGTFFPGGLGQRVVATTVSAAISLMIKNAFNSSAADKLADLRSRPAEYNEYYKKLKRRYGDTRAAKIRKEALS